MRVVLLQLTTLAAARRFLRFASITAVFTATTDTSMSRPTPRVSAFRRSTDESSPLVRSVKFMLPWMSLTICGALLTCSSYVLQYTFSFREIADGPPLVLIQMLLAVGGLLSSFGTVVALAPGHVKRFVLCGRQQRPTVVQGWKRRRESSVSIFFNSPALASVSAAATSLAAAGNWLSYSHRQSDDERRGTFSNGSGHDRSSSRRGSGDVRDGQNDGTASENGDHDERVPEHAADWKGSDPEGGQRGRSDTAGSAVSDQI